MSGGLRPKAGATAGRAALEAEGPRAPRGGAPEQASRGSATDAAVPAEPGSPASTLVTAGRALARRASSDVALKEAPPAGTDTSRDRRPRFGRIALVGNPNVGKSVVFGALTGTYATVSNYPGTTVELTRAAARDNPAIEVIDTPGVDSLTPNSEDERVTRDILLEGVESVVQVADAKNLPRALALSLQLAEAGVPFVVALNMTDEAADRGLRIDSAALASELGVRWCRPSRSAVTGWAPCARRLPSPR